MSEKEESVIEIQDAGLDGVSIGRQISRRAQRRQAEGGYPVDPTAIGPASLRAGEPPLAAADTTDLARLWRSLAELGARSQLQETEFSSAVPLVGPLIVAIRRLWNSVSTRWYLLPVMRQQTAVNTQLVTLLQDVVQRLELNERGLADLQAQWDESAQKVPLELPMSGAHHQE